MRDTALTAIAAHQAIAAFHEAADPDVDAGRSFVLSMGAAWKEAAAWAPSPDDLACSILADFDRAGFEIVRRPKP